MFLPRQAPKYTLFARSEIPSKPSILSYETKTKVTFQWTVKQATALHQPVTTSAICRYCLYELATITVLNFYHSREQWRHISITRMSSRSSHRTALRINHSIDQSNAPFSITSTDVITDRDRGYLQIWNSGVGTNFSMFRPCSSTLVLRQFAHCNCTKVLINSRQCTLILRFSPINHSSRHGIIAILQRAAKTTFSNKPKITFI